MLAIRGSVWRQGARAARTPAFGIAMLAYLFCGWGVVVGALTSSPPADDVPTAQNVSINPQAPPAVTGRPSNSPGGAEPAGDSSAVQIDPQSFAALQKAIDDIDKQAIDDQLEYPRQAVDQPTSAANVPDAPAPGTSLPEESAIAPLPPAVANPAGQTADAPVSATSVPGETATALVPPAVANPDGPATNEPTEQPQGPLPGPAP